MGRFSNQEESAETTGKKALSFMENIIKEERIDTVKLTEDKVYLIRDNKEIIEFKTGYFSLPERLVPVTEVSFKDTEIEVDYIPIKVCEPMILASNSIETFVSLLATRTVKDIKGSYSGGVRVVHAAGVELRLLMKDEPKALMGPLEIGTAKIDDSFTSVVLRDNNYALRMTVREDTLKYEAVYISFPSINNSSEARVGYFINEDWSEVGELKYKGAGKELLLKFLSNVLVSVCWSGSKMSASIYRGRKLPVLFETTKKVPVTIYGEVRMPGRDAYINYGDFKYPVDIKGIEIFGAIPLDLLICVMASEIYGHSEIRAKNGVLIIQCGDMHFVCSGFPKEKEFNEVITEVGISEGEYKVFKLITATGGFEIATNRSYFVYRGWNDGRFHKIRLSDTSVVKML